MKLIIDSNNLLHRAYWVYDSNDNMDINYLFLNSIKKYIKLFNPQEIFCAWDKKLIKNMPNYRNQLLGEGVYKGTRDKKRNEDVYKHEELLRKITNSVGIKNIYPGVLEADDVIWWLCDHFKQDKKTVVSVDTDLYQLVDENTTVYTPIKDIIINKSNFEDIAGVPVHDYISYKSLMGDKSDNIAGVPKCGPKRAKKLLTQNIKKTLNKENYELYLRNIELISLQCGVKYHPEEDHIYRAEVYAKGNLKPDFDKFKIICEEHNIRGILNNFSIWTDIFSRPQANTSIVDIVNTLTGHK